MKETTIFEKVSVNDELPEVEKFTEELRVSFPKGCNLESDHFFVITDYSDDMANYNVPCGDYSKKNKPFWKNTEGDIVNVTHFLKERQAIVLSKESLIELLKEAHEKGSFDFATAGKSVEDSWQQFLTEKGLTETK